jgi:predicted SAM-dependent methyltransferase
MAGRKFRRGARWQLLRIDSSKRYLNAGCGPNPLANFINLDYCWRPGIDLCWDLTQGLPLASASLEGLYCEHCLDHFSRPVALKIMREFHRVLKPGATVRVVVPDAELYIDLYLRAREGEKVAFPYVENPGPSFAPIDPMNRIFREHGHLYAYDAHAMGLLMLEAEFRQPAKFAFLEGRDPKLLVDTPGRRVESLYMEAMAL